MSTNRTMDPKVETILVASANSALASGSLIDGANNTTNLSDGQLGLISARHNQTVAYNAFVAAGTADVADARYVQFVQGTPNSGDLSAPGKNPANDPAFVASHVIDGKSPMTFTAQIAAYPRLSAWIVGDSAGNTGAINVVDEAEYRMNIGFTGVRNDREFAVSGIETYSPGFTTPDYTTLGTTDGLDHLVSNLVFEVNRNSAILKPSNPFAATGQKQVVALAVNVSGGAGTGTGNSTATSIAVVDLQTGSANPVSSIPVMVDNGVTLSIAVTDQMRETFDALVANSVLVAASTIETVNLSTAGTVANREAIILIGTDHNTAIVKDTEDRVKTRLHVGLEYDFNSPNILKVEASTPFEGQGQGSRWKLRWDSRAGLNVYTNQNRPIGEDYLQVPDYIDETAWYNAFIIENKREYPIAYSHIEQLPKRVIILVENTATVGTGLANVVTSLNSIVQTWLETGNLENTILDSGASPAFFV